MKIETKYNLGDKFYRMVDNKPVELRISSIYVDANNEAMSVSYSLMGGGYRFTDVSSKKLESDYYRSKSELMLAVFPDLFKEAKGVYILNEEGGEQ